MPTYDGIGSSVTHEIEVVGDVFISNVEGGSLSTQVPFEIFSNVYGMSPAPTDSRQLRLRVQPTTEASPDDSYVTDMGIQNTTDNYFFITAPQNTSNVGDQNTFVISKTSNVGIGTTNPEKPLHVVGDSWITGTLTASNIIGASPVTISSNLVMASGFTLTAGAIEPPAGSESNLKITGTITTSNITHDSELTVTTNLLMGSDKTLTTSNIVANAGDNLLISSNLEVGTSNLFVDTTTGNVGIGITTPTKPLHVVGDSWITGTLTASNIIGASPVTISSNLVMASGFTLTAGAIEPPAGSESNLKITGTITTSNITHDSELTVTTNLLMGSDKTLTTSNIVANAGDNLLISSNLEVGTSNLFVDTTTGNVGIGITTPTKPLHVVGDSWITGTLTASNIIGASPVTISSNLVMASGFTLTAGAIEPPTGSESNLKITGTITTSNLVANTGDNLQVNSNFVVGTSNLFVDTATSNVGIGTDSPSYKLHVNGTLGAESIQ